MKIENYTNKRANVKAGQLAKFAYVPNQLVYISEVTGNFITFYAFFKEKGEEKVTPKKHSLKRSQIKEFQTLPECFKPIDEVLEMIKAIQP